MSSPRTWLVVSGGLLLWLIVQGPLNPYIKVFNNQKPPNIVLVLGGDVGREHVGLRLSSALNLPLIISGGSNPEHAKWLIEKAGISSAQVKLDYRATDTLSNFTSLVDELQMQEINHILLVTSEDHLSRAMGIGHLIAGSRGIRLTGISVSCASKCKKESLEKQIFDLVRALAWLTTGKDLKIWAKETLPKIFTSGATRLFQIDSTSLDPINH